MKAVWNIVAVIIVAALYAVAIIACIFSWISPLGLFFFGSFLFGYTVAGVYALVALPPGQRFSFLRSHATDLSLQAFVSFPLAILVTFFIGMPILLLIIWVFGITLDSPVRYKILVVLFAIIYFIVFFRGTRAIGKP